MRLIEALVAAGVTRIEAVAFVSPKAVPAMAGAAEVLAAVPRPAGRALRRAVPNVRGAELALADRRRRAHRHDLDLARPTTSATCA